ncbi:MAG: glycoside hydrolase family 25 protein [Muribaculaceae bacterium]
MRHIALFILFSMVAAVATSQIPHIEDRGIEPGDAKGLADTYDGIDVSKYQGDIDWEAIARNKNIKFAYIKATEGATYVDPRFEENISQALKHGVKVGCYHFFRTTSTVADQFENMKQYVRRDEQSLVPMIDVESMGKWNQQQLVDSLHAFAVMIYEHYKVAPIIYTYVNFYNRHLSGRFTNYPLFIARYTETEPELNDGTKYVIWQYTERGRVNGIKGNVDLSRFGNGYSVHDISIKSQHIVGTTGLDIKPEDLVLDGSEIKAITPSKFKTTISKEREEDLLKLKRQQAEEEKRLRKEREKQAKKQAKEAAKRAEEEAKARRLAAERGETLEAADSVAAQGNTLLQRPDGKTVTTRKSASETTTDKTIRYSTRKRTE